MFWTEGLSLHREIGSASTWSLERLDALAAEAAALFRTRCLMGPAPVKPRDPPPPLEPKPRRRSTSLHLHPDSAATRGNGQGTADSKASASSAENQQQSTGRGTGSGPNSPVSDSGRLDDGSVGVTRSRVNGPNSRKGRRQKQGRQGGPGTADTAELSSSREGQRRQSRPRAHERHKLGPVRGVRSPVCDYPVQALAAVNDVLFERHGYRRMTRHGDPRCALLYPRN